MTCLIADGYTFSGSASDDDIPVICAFDFLEFTEMILPPTLFCKVITDDGDVASRVNKRT